MAGFQNSNKLYTDSSNTTALTTVNPHYSQQHPHPATPTSPAPSLPNSNSTTSTNITTNANTSAKSTITSIPRSLNTTSLLQHSNNSAFTPYQNNIPQHPTPVTTPTSTKPQLHPDSTMMTSHLENNTLIYPQHHYTNPPNQFWHPSWHTLSGGGSPAGTVAIPNTAGNSAFMPTVGYGPAASSALSQHNPRPKLTTTIWEDEGTLCYQVDARGICVARRQDNNMINGTKLLNVVGMSRGKRDGILKNEKGRVVVKVGAMHLKGVWITFGRAKTLAQQFKIHELLYPLFVEDPGVFLHSYPTPMQANRIPSIGGVSAHAQWRPHTFTGTFNGPAYDRWYGYSNGNAVGGIINQNPSQHQDHNSPAYQSNPSNHTSQHIDDEYSNYTVINGQPQGQQNVVVSGTTAPFQPRSPVTYDTGAPNAINSGPNARSGTPVYSNIKTEDTVGNNGNNYYRPPGIYNIVSADVANGTAPQSNPPSQIIGQKRGYVADDEADDYNGSNQPSPPLAMHPPPLSGIPVNTAMNVAAGSFPSPMNGSPNVSPSSSAFSGWPAKRVKYEFSESTAPSSAQSSPRIAGYTLPGLTNGAGASAAPTTPTQTYNSPLQLMTNAQGSPHNYSSAGANANGPATGTTTPTTEGYFQDNSTVLQTSSPDNAPVDETRRYEQYRREESTSEEINNNNAWGVE